MYFVCETCNAKWFAETNVMPCPRCGTLRGSKEEIKPPWKTAGTTMRTVSEIAKALRVSAGVVYREISRHRLPCYRIGGAIRISEEHLQEYLKRREEVVETATGYKHVKRIGG